VVLNQRLTSETANSSGMRQNHEPLEQRCANTAPLLLVRNGYRYVGGIWDLFQPEASHEAQRLCFLPLGVQRQGTKCDVIKSVGTRKEVQVALGQLGLRGEKAQTARVR
jgi:hypothetical protein